MGSVGTNSPVLVFGEFLGYLRVRGFRIGIDHHLRLHELLDRIGGRCEPQGLKTLLAPIFATDKNQQEQFYQAFDSYFEFFQPAVAKPTPDVEKKLALTIDLKEGAVLKRRSWLYAIATVLTVLSLFTVLLLSSRLRASKETIQQSQPGPVSTPGSAQSEPIAGSESDLPATPATPIAQPRVASPSFIESYGTALRRAAIGTPLIIFFFYELYSYTRRKLVLQKQRGRKPPLVWPLHIEQASPKLYDSETFYDAARLMRKRQADEFYRLDVEATVAATIESLGYPRFRYRFGSKPPEYLILIDRASFRDHQASFFDGLAKAFEREGIYVKRYFYDADPRICCDERGKQCFSLTELHSRSASHRLIIIGAGDQMLNPISGKLASWTAVLTDWQYRGILTPTPAAQWGLHELSLSNEFIILPATVDGLLALTDCFDSGTTGDFRSWRRNGDRRLPPELSDNPRAKEELREYLGEGAFQWLCACAVYPELHWDLTVYLGSLPALGTNLVQEDHLLRLIRLPWFRSGSMPDEMRWLLINELDQKEQTAVRSAIIELLEKHPPPKESYAADTYRLNLVVQRWLSRRDRKARRELSQVLKDSPRNQLIQDYTLLRLLETTGSALHLVLPSQLRRLFYRDSIPQLGLNTGIRALITLLVMSGIWFSTLPMSKVKSPPTSSAVSGLANDLPATPKKQYLAMTRDEQRQFVQSEAQHVARMIGIPDGDASTPEVVGKIKIWVDAYARRLQSPKPSGGCNMRHDLDTLLKRASNFAPLVIKAFNEKGLSPQVGIYLAMIESEYCPCLSSGTGPKGFFQLAASTARRYGVQDVSAPLDTRPDDRCKIEVIAPIAAQLMKDLISMFGTSPLSVPLAICSYNSGEGGLSTNLATALNAARISDNPERSFWTLVANADLMSDVFQREMFKYVPHFFGAAIVGENPRVFGVDLAPISSYTQTQSAGSDTVRNSPVDQESTDLATIEAYASTVLTGISKEERPVLNASQLNEVFAYVKRFKGSSSLAKSLEAMNSALPQVSTAANRSSVKPQLVVYTTLARIDMESGSGDPGKVASQLAPELAKMTRMFGDELGNDALLSVAALEEGQGLQLKITKLAARVNDSPATIRSVWYLHDHQVISEKSYDFVMRFLAVGIIAQDPQKFGISAEPLQF